MSKSGRLYFKKNHQWKDEVLKFSGIKILAPTINEMLDSTLLPLHHKDPFDRLLIAQAKANSYLLVTKDTTIQEYPVKTFWM